MALCQSYKDIEAIDLLAQMAPARGGNNNPDGLGGWSGKSSELLVNTDNISIDKKPRAEKTGTSATYTMRRLSKHFPAIHARVLAGELSINRAA